MSLQFDPDFVAKQVVLLETDVKEIGELFISKSQQMFDVKSLISDRNAQLRLLLLFLFYSGGII